MAKQKVDGFYDYLYKKKKVKDIIAKDPTAAEK